MERELLINETESYNEIIQQIRQAKESIYICMYIWRDDEIGNLIAKELLAAADRGVEIEIVKDKAASVFERVEQYKQSFFHKNRDICSSIKECVISLLYYRDNKRSKRQYTNKKLNRMLEHKNITIRSDEERNDHSKFYIFDNRVLILGGINIGNKTVDELKEEYADYMIKFVDSELVTHFLDRLAGNLSNVGYQDIEFSLNLREQDIFEIKPKILKLLEEAKYRIDIEMAYFGDPDITDKIIEAAQRGVNITVITSKDSNVQQALNQMVLEKIISRSNSEIKVYLSDRMVHSKFMCVDRNNFFLGSANFHKLGMSKLSELNVLVKNGDNIYSKWKTWRQEHLQECTLISRETNLNYNKLIALTERVFC
ncbi:hypothetical protein JCM16358_11410 [Halanaerocella petrolearia]